MALRDALRVTYAKTLLATPAKRISNRTKSQEHRQRHQPTSSIPIDLCQVSGSSTKLRSIGRTNCSLQTASMADREQPVTLRTRKFIRNPLLGRKQMVV